MEKQRLGFLGRFAALLLLTSAACGEDSESTKKTDAGGEDAREVDGGADPAPVDDAGKGGDSADAGETGPLNLVETAVAAGGFETLAGALRSRPDSTTFWRGRGRSRCSRRPTPPSRS